MDQEKLDPRDGEGKEIASRLKAIYQKAFNAFAGPEQFRHNVNYPHYHGAGLLAVHKHYQDQLDALRKSAYSTSDVESFDPADSELVCTCGHTKGMHTWEGEVSRCWHNAADDLHEAAECACMRFDLDMLQDMP